MGAGITHLGVVHAVWLIRSSIFGYDILTGSLPHIMTSMEMGVREMRLKYAYL